MCYYRKFRRLYKKLLSNRYVISKGKFSYPEVGNVIGKKFTHTIPLSRSCLPKILGTYGFRHGLTVSIDATQIPPTFTMRFGSFCNTAEGKVHFSAGNHNAS